MLADALAARLVTLAEDAASAARDPGTREELIGLVERIRGPVRLAIAGKVKAGKSTLLNALIGEDLAATDAGECTRVVSWYRRSPRPFVRLHPMRGPAEERPWSRGPRGLEIDLGGRDLDTIDRLEIGWPTSRLDGLVLIDTPGIASLSTAVSQRTHVALSAETGHEPVADAVLYLLRHTHATDLRFLEAFHDDEVAHGTPVNTIGVLSRADEIGSSRLDAMTVADRIARRYEADPRLHRLCPLVVPVDGLLGHAAATLGVTEHATLAAIAAAGPSGTEILLTADRFAARVVPGLPTPQERTRLLDRMGLFGVRLAVELIATGAAVTSGDLAERLSSASGVDRVRELVLARFRSRAQVLQARSAVAALERLLSADARAVQDVASLRRRLEELTSGAHEFEEVRVLLALRAGEISVPDHLESELDLLLGGAGDDAGTRLGLGQDATPWQVQHTAQHALGRWQALARHPLAARPTQIAARAATRTIEGILAPTVGGLR